MYIKICFWDESKETRIWQNKNDKICLEKREMKNEFAQKMRKLKVKMYRYLKIFRVSK
jgi:hypothetical protein